MSFFRFRHARQLEHGLGARELRGRSGALWAVRALAAAVDAKDPYTRHHSARVSHYATLIAQRLELSTDRIYAIAAAGELHDVGKLTVPDAILLKESRLSDGEFELMKEHAVEGERIARVAGLDEMAPWIRHHHERWDGGGYPDGLGATEIPLESRILVAADSLDAMTSDRSYRVRLAIEETRRELERHAGAQFDPHIAEILIALVDEGTVPLPAAYGTADSMVNRIVAAEPSRLATAA